MAVICNHNVYNFTPHDCTFVEPDGYQTPIPAEGIVVRLTETREIGRAAYGFPVTVMGYGEPEGLPQRRDRTLFLVSQLVVRACPDRDDLVYPAGLLRDDAGRVIGFTEFAR